MLQEADLEVSYFRISLNAANCLATSSIGVPALPARKVGYCSLPGGATATLIRIKFRSGKGAEGENNEGSCYRRNG